MEPQGDHSILFVPPAEHDTNCGYGDVRCAAGAEDRADGPCAVLPIETHGQEAEGGFHRAQEGGVYEVCFFLQYVHVCMLTKCSFGVPAVLLELIPIAGIFFSFTNTVGAALWAADIEEKSAPGETTAPGLRSQAEAASRKEL